jgi:hypothetical protein
VKLIYVNGEREVAGTNARMKLLLGVIEGNPKREKKPCVTYASKQESRLPLFSWAGDFGSIGL